MRKTKSIQRNYWEFPLPRAFVKRVSDDCGWMSGIEVDFVLVLFLSIQISSYKKLKLEAALTKEKTAKREKFPHISKDSLDKKERAGYKLIKKT